MRDRAAIVRLLREAGPFRGLGEMELRTLAHLLDEAVYDEGATVFAEGDEAHEAFVVLEGKVDIVTTIDDVVHVRKSLQAGDLFGELGLFQAGRRLAGAMARGPTVLAAMASEAFVAAIRAHPAIALALLRMQAERFAELELSHRRMIDDLVP